MRVLLRLIAPLLGLGLAAAGVLLAIEVTVAWIRTGTTSGLVVPWPAWRIAAETTPWATPIMAVLGIAVALTGLLLLLIGLLARRHDIALAGPAPGMTVTTSPRVLARLVGRRVRAADDVSEASVTATARKISVRAHGIDGTADPALRDSIGERVEGLLDELPLARRPRVGVVVQERKGL